MLSVVIPVFKTPLKLRRRCLDSLKGLECEIIEVDGLPLAEARNEGLKKAKGEWVWFVDADDEVGELFDCSDCSIGYRGRLVYLKGYRDGTDGERVRMLKEALEKVSG